MYVTVVFRAYTRLTLTARGLKKGEIFQLWLTRVESGKACAYTKLDTTVTTSTNVVPDRFLTLSAGKYSSSLQAVMDAGTLGLGLVVEMQNAIPSAVRAASTWLWIVRRHVVPPSRFCEATGKYHPIATPLSLQHKLPKETRPRTRCQASNTKGLRRPTR